MKSILITALNQITAEKNDAVARAIAKNKTTVIIPYFTKVNNLKTQKIEEARKRLEAENAAAKSTYDNEVATITATTENQKAKFAKEQVEECKNSVEYKYTTRISELKKIIEDNGED